MTKRNPAEEFGAQYPAAAKGPAGFVVSAGGSGRPFICVHSIVGQVGIYQDLVRALDADACAMLVNALPHLTGRVEADTMRDLVSIQVKDLRGRLSQLAPIVVGFCHGGLFAYELSLQLSALGQAPRLLVLIDTVFPIHPALNQGEGQLSVGGWLSFIETYISTRCVDIVDNDKSFWVKPTEEKLTHLAELWRDEPALLLPRAFEAETLRIHFSRYAKFLGSLDAWSPAPYGGNALLIRSTRSRWNTNWISAEESLVGDVARADINMEHLDLMNGLGARIVAAEIKKAAQ